MKVPVTVKIRLGWNATHLNYLELAQAIVDGGADAITVHGRTREARYRQPADWEAISAVAAAVTVPVIGNGDLLFPHEVQHRLASSGCTAVMSARGALIKPWIFRELSSGYWDISAEERIAIYQRYVELAIAHWGQRPDRSRRDESQVTEPDALETVAEATEPEAPAIREGLDAHGHERVREFLRWHVGFWVRYAPQRPDGTWPTMQTRESSFVPRSPLESLLTRQDDAALDFITDELIRKGDFSQPPPAGGAETDLETMEAG